MRYRFSIFFLLLSAAASAQDTLSGSYATLSLLPGTYIARGSVSVDSALVINAGVTILFTENSTLVCMGGVSMEGTAANRIILQSVASRRGGGLVIKNQREKVSVVARHVQFVGLSSALRFEEGWIRKAVIISDCEFIDNKSASPVVSVMNPLYEAGLENPLISFDVERSVFTKNGASLYFEDFNNTNLLIKVVNNLFANNRITDFGVYNFSGNVLFGRADQTAPSFSAVVERNSFLQNFLISIVDDTVVQRVSVGVYGNADSVRASQNFWGTSQVSVIRDGLFDFFTNYTAPRLTVEPFLIAPPSLAPTHIYRVCLKEKSTAGNLALCNLLDAGVSFGDKEVTDIHLFANRPLRGENAQVIYTWLDDSLQQQTRLLSATLLPVNNENKIVLSIDSTETDRIGERPGYLTVSGFKGENDETVPMLLIGYDAFLRDKYTFQKRAEAQKRIVSTKDAASEKEPPSAGVTQLLLSSKKSRLYVIAAVNVSSQLINDIRPLQQLVFPISSINSSQLQPGFGGGFRWDHKLFKPVSASVVVGYSYIRPTQTLQHSDTLPPFRNRFASFVPRNSFQLAGVQAGIAATLLSTVSLVAGAAIDYNLTQRTIIDKETPSYQQNFYSYYAGLEAALSGRGQLPPVLVGIKWRRWNSNISIPGVTNEIDLVELTTSFSISKPNSASKSLKK
jgi:hypothetical protein